MNRSLVYSGIAILVIAAIVGVLLFYQLPSPDTPPTQAQPPSAAPTGQARKAPAAESVGDQALLPMAPEFDIVRVDENGNVVIAGRATPDCTIVVRDGDTVIGTVSADRRGDWVLVPDEPFEPGQRELSIVAECGSAEPVPSNRVVVLAVPERGTGALVVAVPREGGGPSRVLQTPTETTDAGARPEVAIGAVDYDDAGDLALSGTAPPGATVQVYVDNELIGRTRADDQGRWSITPDRKVDPGAYTLRVDQVTPEGKVLARAEIPFVRGEPLTDLPPGRVVIIQPGDYLWKIARERYGSGFQYTLIFDANREQIRNPDLIFPGQVFLVPAVN